MPNPKHRAHDRPASPHARNATTDEAASNMVAMLLGLGIVVTLFGPMWMLTDSIMGAMQTQREAADKAAWCARHPDRTWPGEGECPSAGPRGWDCEPASYHDALKCVPVDATDDPDDYTLIRSNPDNVSDVVQTR